MSKAIVVEDISKSYRIGKGKARSLSDAFGSLLKPEKGRDTADFWALKNISFEVSEGEAFCVIGGNGAGKSTLLKILSRITYPDSGQVKIYGRVSSLLEVGTGFHPELSGRENVYLNGTILGMKRTEVRAKFDEIVEFSGVSKFIDTPIKHYSSGMKVRLAFAVAAHLEPEILIIDEVLAVGDAEFQKKCLGKMEEVTGKGRTVLFVSHNMAAVKTLCSTGVLLNRGQIAQAGSVENCIESYVQGPLSKSRNEFNDETRYGTGNVKIRNLSLIDRDQRLVDYAFVGMLLRIKVDLEATSPPSDLIIKLQFISSGGQVLFVCNNYHSSTAFKLKSLRATAVCTINNLSLNEGSYSINVTCLENYDVSDEISGALRFNVEKGDFFGTGKLPNPSQGMLMAHQWELYHEK